MKFTDAQIEAMASVIDRSDDLGCGCCTYSTCPACNDYDADGHKGPCVYDMTRGERIAREVAAALEAS